VDQNWIGMMIFKNFADQDWIGLDFIGSGLDSDWKISQSAHLWSEEIDKIKKLDFVTLREDNSAKI